MKVETYSGYRADERPVRFELDGRRLKVERIVRQWRTPEKVFFKVEAEDRQIYTLAYDVASGEWEITATQG